MNLTPPLICRSSKENPLREAMTWDYLSKAPMHEHSNRPALSVRSLTATAAASSTSLSTASILVFLTLGTFVRIPAIKPGFTRKAFVGLEVWTGYTALPLISSRAMVTRALM
ncbi:hypothetical protein F5Y03DRAFT_336936 [Xylaria venustula]|nr:hypothetical protein F5Y03DRAFT_336936 [Xylaria venustula]